MNNTSTQITSFLDNIGRTIVGKVSKQDNELLSIENPVVVHIQANPATNQLQLQLLPLFFREFQSNKSDSTIWNFNKSSITTSESIVFNEQFLAQYEQIFSPVQQTPQAEPKVVKLFDEDSE